MPVECAGGAASTVKVETVDFIEVVFPPRTISQIERWMREDVTSVSFHICQQDLVPLVVWFEIFELPVKQEVCLSFLSHERLLGTITVTIGIHSDLTVHPRTNLCARP